MDTSVPVTTGGPRDARLRRVRRLDWRFLLGEPVLGDVLVAGAPDAELIDALAAEAPSVRSIAVDEDGHLASGPPDTPLADLAVIVGAVPAATVAAVRAAVRPGGAIVIELTGGPAWRPGRSLRSALADGGRMRRRVEAVTGGAAVSYLAWPDHARRTAFVPLSDAVARDAWVRGRMGGGWRGAALAGIVRAGIGTPLLPAFTPATTVVARVPGDPPGSGSTAAPLGWLRSRTARALGLEAAAVADPIVITPTYRASSHVVGLVVDAGSADGPTAVIKAARLADDGARIAHEAAALERVADGLGADGLAPALLELVPDGPAPYLVETGLVGRPLDPATVRRDPVAAARAVAALAARMPRGAGPDAPLRRLVEPALDAVRGHAAATGNAPLVAATADRLGPVMDRPVPIVLEHGDLSHPNLVVTPGGALGAVDWERAEAEGLPLHDLTMALAYVAWAAVDATSPDDQAAAVAAGHTGPDPWLRDLVDAELARLAIPDDLRWALAVVPWLRTAAWLAPRTDPTWWAADRAVGLWRAMLEAPR